MGAQMNPQDEIRLLQILDDANAPFAWGQNDCNTLGFAWVDYRCGTYWIARIRGKYSNAREAALFAAEYPRWSEILSDLGWTKVNPLLATTGSVVVVPDRWWDCVHLLHGGYVHSVDTERGFISAPVVALANAEFWRLG